LSDGHLRRAVADELSRRATACWRIRVIGQYDEATRVTKGGKANVPGSTAPTAAGHHTQDRIARRRLRAQVTRRRGDASEHAGDAEGALRALWLPCERTHANFCAAKGLVTREDNCALGAAYGGPKRRAGA